MLTSYSFYPKITVPTRLTNNHGTLIDNFLCKLTESTLDITAGVLIKKFSDHQPYFILLNNVQTRESPPVFVKVTKQDNESRHNFDNELLTSNELFTLPDSLNDNPNNSYNILHQVIQNAKTKHTSMPTKFVKYNKYKHKRSKWITSGIIKSIQYKDNLYKKLKTTNSNSIQFAIHKTNLDTYNNILKRSIRLAKRNYYQTIFSKFKDGIRGTWKIFNEILSRTKRKKSFPLFLKMEIIL